VGTVFDDHDMTTLAELVCESWEEGADSDWSATAGTVEWTCTATADHAVDTVLAPAFFLASRKIDGYADYGWDPFLMGDKATPRNLIDGLRTATRVLIGVVVSAEPQDRAAIWRRPTVEARPPADFVPRGAMELILHGHDIALGLGVEFEPPADLCARLREHTAEWPMWKVWGDRLTFTDDPWGDLLRGGGRARREGP
jgi:hypothetical protein